MALIHIGGVYQIEGDLWNALAYFRDSAEIMTSTPERIDRPFLARTMNHVGNLYLQLGDTAGMLSAFVEAVRAFREEGESEAALAVCGEHFNNRYFPKVQHWPNAVTSTPSDELGAE
jgi:hypothetical protein